MMKNTPKKKNAGSALVAHTTAKSLSSSTRGGNTRTKRPRVLSPRVARLEKSVRPTQESIDFSDIPELTDEQLAKMRRGRPTIGPSRRLPKLVQIDPRVDAWLKRESQERGKAYQAVLNDVLLAHIGDRGHREVTKRAEAAKR